VQTVADAVKQVGGQAPAPAQPLADQVNRVADTVGAACRQLPACP
jgi:hypothetical protein